MVLTPVAPAPTASHVDMQPTVALSETVSAKIIARAPATEVLQSATQLGQ